ncbi:hypothetical protein EC973_008509 [Apophysomyces ossiformis]|uniref:NAD(P)-binding domain-containing protein n=1 Tax=Apophysomyces ossiformis TaxID=679940 RepID=A0A8H7BNB5_9FUNG|nr:hypothetical protein EC973_008509 [Apophysomyces ossiformis]
MLKDDRNNTHEQLVKTISNFDKVDIGERKYDIVPELQNVRNILVTGGYGFLGSFLVRKLVVLYPEYHIYVVDKLEYRGSTRNLKSVKDFPNFTGIRGDITSSEFVSFILKEKRIDVIFHLAAQTHIDRSFGDSFEFTTNNVMATHVMLEAARIYGIKRFIHVSTDEVYGGPDAILAPSNPYSATKAAAEFLVMAYHKSFGLPTIITRSNSIYGPYQYPEKIISNYIHGNGQNSRRYIYAADVADALDLVFRKGEVNEIYNVGCETEFSNLQLCKKLIRLFGYPEEQIEDHIEFVQDRPLNDKRYNVSYSKLEALGWKPKVDIDSGLLRTSK